MFIDEFSSRIPYDDEQISITRRLLKAVQTEFLAKAIVVTSNTGIGQWQISSSQKRAHIGELTFAHVRKCADMCNEN